MGRRLRRKRARAALWYSADGNCQECGRPLPLGWHADHVVPWSISGQTNVHEMQALCPECNLRKGSKMLRKPQLAVKQICAEIRSGAGIRRIIAAVTPGGGKSLIPVICANELIPRQYEKLCWIVPRIALQEQAESAFLDPIPAEIEDLSHEIRISTNEVDPCRGKSGFTTTYQALAIDEGWMMAEELRRHRYILVLDEPHHVESGGKWHASVKKLIDRAGLVIFMSGTLERGDGKAIAELPYSRNLTGKLVCDPVDTDDTRVIRYSRKEALLEHAIIPIEFIHSDGKVKWIDRSGFEDEIDSLTKLDETTGSGLYAALHTPYAIGLLDQCLADWNNVRKIRPRSKLLVVAPSIRQAKVFLAHIKARGYSALLAVSEDSEEAQANIRKFKRTDLNATAILVTVAMAYEGMDVPSITHVACLTLVRSKPWLDQMFNRSSRVDKHAGPWEHQTATIHVPDDPMMQQVIEAIKAEQTAALAEMKLGEDRGTKDRPDDIIRGDVIPIDGQWVKARASDMASGEVDYMETQKLQAIIQAQNLPIGTVQLKKAIAAFQLEPEAVHTESASTTASQREQRSGPGSTNSASEWTTNASARNGGKRTGLSFAPSTSRARS